MRQSPEPFSWHSRVSQTGLLRRSTQESGSLYVTAHLKINGKLQPGFSFRVRANTTSHFIPTLAQKGRWERIPTQDISTFGWVLSFWHNQHELNKSEILLGGAVSSVFFFFSYFHPNGSRSEKESKKEKNQQGKRRLKGERGKEQKWGEKPKTKVLDKDLLVVHPPSRP